MNRSTFKLVALVSILSLYSGLASSSWGQTSYPMLQSTSPVAVQAGTTAEVVVTSSCNMHGAYRVIFEGEGVSAEIVPPEVKQAEPKEGETPKPPDVRKLTLKVTVDEKAQTGVRDFRIAAPQGPSTLGQLVIVRDTVFYETKDNDQITDAQSVTLPATICGCIEKNEDLDYFKFQAEAGQSFSFYVRGMRLQDKIHNLQAHMDPILTLRNPQGATVAAADNYFAADPLMSYKFDQSGEYTLEVRDVRYEGNAAWEYSIEISDKPLVTNVYPLAVAPGQPAQLELVGLNLPETKTVTFEVPNMTPKSSVWLPVSLESGQTNPVPLVVTDLPLVQETTEENNSQEKSQAITGPTGINGRIESPGDVDVYTFECKKGDAWSMEIIARRQQSELDAQFWILNEEGKRLTFAEDGQAGKKSSADPALDHWVAPADGKYSIEVRDLHLRGGVEYVYFFKLKKSVPRYELFIDTDKTLLTPGMSNVIFVRANRIADFKDAIDLQVEGLPPGVTAECGQIRAVEDGDPAITQLNRSGGPAVDGCIVLHTAEDAPQGISNLRITGNTTRRIDESTTVTTTTEAAAYQEIYLPGGGRGHWPVLFHTVGVGEKSDLITMKLSTRELTFKPGEKQVVTVTIERSSGFDKNVSLSVIYQHLNSVFANTLPRGVTVEARESKTLLDGKTSEGKLTFKADEKAPPIEKQFVPVMAHVSLNFVMKTTFTTGPLLITVLPKEDEAAK